MSLSIEKGGSLARRRDRKPLIQSKITAQGQISVPAEVRKMLGVGPGSMIEWEERDGEFIVRRAARSTSEDIHKALFPEGPPSGPPADVKAAIAKYIREKHARR